MKVKKALSMAMIFLTVLSIFSTFAPKAEAETVSEGSDQIVYYFDSNNGDSNLGYNGYSPWGVSLDTLPEHSGYHTPAREGYIGYEDEYNPFKDEEEYGFGYYGNSQWPDKAHWNWDGTYVGDGSGLPPGVEWHAGIGARNPNALKVLIYAPWSGKSCVVVIGDSGPAPWTGRQFGVSSKTFDALGLPESYERADGKTFDRGNPNPGHAPNKYTNPADYPVIKYADNPYWVEVSWAPDDAIPGPIQTATNEISGIPLIGQETPNSCWAASSLMILRYYEFYGPDVSQIQVAREIGHEEWYYNGYQQNLLDLLIGTWESTLERLGKLDASTEWTDAGEISPNPDSGLSFADIVADVNSNRPIIALKKWDSTGHAVVVIGYIDNPGEDEDYVILNDPADLSGNYPNPGRKWTQEWTAFKNDLGWIPILPWPQALRTSSRVEKPQISIQFMEGRSSGILRFMATRLSGSSQSWGAEARKWDATGGQWATIPGVPDETDIHDTERTIDIDIDVNGGGNYRLVLSAYILQPATWSVRVIQTSVYADAIVVNGDSLLSTWTNGDARAFHVFTSPVGFLTSTHSDTFVIMSSGIAENIPGSPEHFESNDFGTYGTADDTVYFTLRLLVPDGATTLSFDFRFMSEEYPEWVGTQYNDFFYAYLMDSTGTHQIAFDDNGNIININNNFFNPNIYPIGTVFDGATKRLTTTVDVNQGETITLQFVVGDVGDGIYDTAVFLDNVRFNVGGSPGTTPTADVIVVKNGPNSAEQGKQFTYTLNYFNIEEGAAENVVVLDELPPQVDFISASNGGVHSSATHSVSWSLGTLAPFSSGSLTLIVSVPSGIPIGTVLENTASISTTSQESSSQNNDYPKSTTVTGGASLPPNVEVGPTVSNHNGIPVLYWTTPTTFTYHGDANVIGVDINIHLPDGGPDIGGPMINTAGTYDWTFTYTFYPRHGQGIVTYTVHYADGSYDTIGHDILVDPSGYVYNAITGQRVEGATVTLFRFDTVLMQFVIVPSDDLGIDPHINPQITDENGGYGWMVSPGMYMVRAEKDGYATNFAIVTVPPPATDLNIPLTPIDTTHPTTQIVIGAPHYIDSLSHTYVTSDTSFTLTADDGPEGSGVDATYYRHYNLTYDSDWTGYSDPFYLEGLEDGSYSIDYYSTDVVGNVEPTNTLNVTLDNTAPEIVVSNPPAGWALQDGVTFLGSITDAGCGVFSMSFSIREANDGEGTPIGYEDMPVSYDSNTGEWSFSFDTLLVPDGYYVLYIEAEDNLGNGNSTTVFYSIRNWAVIELLPSSENNKAGRTMPVKFALRVAAEVDPAQPFVYNEELRIEIFATADPDDILQESYYGDAARDYRISSVHYITNFRTIKRKPMEYTVAIYRETFDVGSFTFETVK